MACAYEPRRLRSVHRAARDGRPSAPARLSGRAGVSRPWRRLLRDVRRRVLHGQGCLRHRRRLRGGGGERLPHEVCEACDDPRARGGLHLCARDGAARERAREDLDPLSDGGRVGRGRCAAAQDHMEEPRHGRADGIHARRRRFLRGVRVCGIRAFDVSRQGNRRA